jgi:apolipoprotein N-acyltransferase
MTRSVSGNEMRHGEERPAGRVSNHARLVSAGLSLTAGALAAFAFPPWGFLPGLLGYALLMGLLDRSRADRPARSGFWRGWLAGTAYFLVSTWWVAEAFLVDAQNQGGMAPFAVGLLAAGLGLFWGVVGAIYSWLRPRGVSRLLVFAGLFCALEWLRGHVLTGFPWDLAGETWRAGSPLSQAASVVGAYGLGWITVCVCASPALLIDPAPRAKSKVAVALAAGTLATLFVFGVMRLATPMPIAPNAPLVRVVQADVRQESKYDAALYRDIVARYVALTARPAARAPDIVVWPEGAIPNSANDFLAPDAWTRAEVIGALRPGQTLMMGAYRVDGTPARPIYFNSLISLRRGPDDLAVTGVYDKFRLVPFGEYLPLDNVLTPLGFKDLTHIGDGFTAGQRPTPMTTDGVPKVQPLICYESLYPGFVREGAVRAGRPAWIANVSNDAWFGPTSGPLQHLNLASYRAIEEGLPIVRATPTGVSAVIDAYGRIRPGARLGPGVEGIIDAPLPPALKPTSFARFGDLGFWLMMAVSAVTLMWNRRGGPLADIKIPLYDAFNSRVRAFVGRRFLEPRR